MNWYKPIIIYGKEYSFIDVEDEPLRLELKLSNDYILYRDIDIDCDSLSERMFLVHFYGPLTKNMFERKHISHDVYRGKEIEDPSLMTQLLEHILYYTEINPIHGKESN